MEGTLSSAPAQTRATNVRGGEWLRLVTLTAALCLLGAGADSVRRATQPAPEGSPELSTAGWEGRRLMAQFLWIKTHAVLHAGVEEREARPGEKETRAGEYHTHGAKEGGHGHGDGDDDEDGHVLSIPPPQEDFRGVLGDLEREVKPYKGKDGRLFSKDSEQTIPFYRLMTWTDPHFIQGYTIGATFIARAGQFADKGLQFLHEGERNNPRSFEIQTELGRFYLVYKHDYPTAERYLRRAVQLIPQDRKLTDLEDDERMDAYHWLALTYVEWKRPTDAVKVARQGIAALGSDRMLKKVVDRRGVMVAPGT
jgi:hypothetical protein